MASGAITITSWQRDGETMETVTDFIFLGYRITVDGDCSLEIKTPAPWKESYDKPRQHIKKQRHHFVDKVISLLFSMLSSLVIAFLPRIKDF